MVLLLCLASCQNTRDVSSMKTAFKLKETLKVGVIPFENLTPNIKAGEDMARYCYNEFFRQLYHEHHTQIGPYQLAMEDEYRLQEIMHKEKWIDQSAHIDIGLAKMADTLGVDLMLIGTVSEYHYKRGLGEDPVASLHLRLYDRHHDTVIWSGSHSRVGHFSWFKEDALGRLAHQVSKELIERCLIELEKQSTPKPEKSVIPEAHSKKS